jgi:hypothetical protein
MVTDCHSALQLITRLRNCSLPGREDGLGLPAYGVCEQQGGARSGEANILAQVAAPQVDSRPCWKKRTMSYSPFCNNKQICQDTIAPQIIEGMLLPLRPSVA